MALFVIGFAIANRQRVVVSFNPLAPGSSFSSMELPLWLLFFLGLLVGVVSGWIGCWFAQGKHRKRAREAMAEASRLRSENTALTSGSDPVADAQQRQIVPMGTAGWI